MSCDGKIGTTGLTDHRLPGDDAPKGDKMIPGTAGQGDHGLLKSEWHMEAA
jgi:hypothetical protein